ncbi:type II secretion system F family protein [bacterium]|jgi:tight adherence protein C|nr:type II secretion system F family protein [bacterium]
MPMPVLAILVFSCVVASCLLVLRPVFGMQVDNYGVRIRPRKQTDDTSAEKPKDSVILKLAEFVGQFALSLMPALADKRTVILLNMANYRTPQHMAIFIGIKVLLTGSVLVMTFFSAITNPIMLLGGLIGAIPTWIMPNFFLGSRVKKRQDQILKELPVIIDLLIVCAQAGLGMMLAIDKVSKEVVLSCPILSIEMQQLISDVKVFAKSVPYAMREMGERCGVDELINMASALIAAEAKGADMSYPLRQQAAALRDRLKRKKEEEAGKVPVKMVPVIMVFVMPLILCPMLGPAVVTILNAIGPIMSGLK